MRIVVLSIVLLHYNILLIFTFDWEEVPANPNPNPSADRIESR